MIMDSNWRYQPDASLRAENRERSWISNDDDALVKRLVGNLNAAAAKPRLLSLRRQRRLAPARAPRIKSVRTDTGWGVLVFSTSARARRREKKKRDGNHRRGEKRSTGPFLIVTTGKDFRANSSETGCGPWRLTRPAATAGNELEKWQKFQVGELCPWTLDCCL